MAAEPTAVIPAATTWKDFPALWPQLLGEVWGVVRGDATVAPGRNVMLYRDDAPNVEVVAEIGVEVGGAFSGSGRVVPSALPSGRAATTTHVGRAQDLAFAHEAVIAWCERRGLERTGVRWEVYGHQREDTARARDRRLLAAALNLPRA